MSQFQTANPGIRADAFTGWRNVPGMEMKVAQTGMATVSGTINATLILTTCCAAAAIGTATLAQSYPSFAGIGGLIAMLVSLVLYWVVYAKPMAARYIAFPFAVCEGIFLGLFSMWATSRLAGTDIGGKTGAGAVYLALGGTIAVLMAMLGLYRAGILRASPMFVRIMAISGAALLVVILGILAASLFGANVSSVTGNAPIAIGLTVVLLIYSAFCFIVDFGAIESYVEQGSPKAMEWYGAFLLLSTLATIYFYILKLLVQIAGRRD